MDLLRRARDLYRIATGREGPMNERKRLLERLIAQEYQREQLRERSSTYCELDWPFPLTPEEQAFVTAIARGNWAAAKLTWEDPL